MSTNYKKLTFDDKDYPTLLKEISWAPEELFYLGNLDLLKKSCISVVGTRRFSDYGEFVTEKIISELAIADIVIVSGLAKGIDTIVHRAALKNSLPTIAVLGTGITNIYPEENTFLAEEIVAANGLVLSEFVFMEPRKEIFPRRNRIISGISLGTVVIEAPEKSGALITANFALDQNREVFTVPADLDRKNSLGNLNLLHRGHAHAISSGRDIINILNNTSQKIAVKELSNKISKMPLSHKQNLPQINYKLNSTEQKIFNQLPIKRPITLEKIYEKTNVPINEILAAISIFEIYGIVIIKDGKYYRCC